MKEISTGISGGSFEVLVRVTSNKKNSLMYALSGKEYEGLLT
jgi:hypothetical protein